MLKTLLSWLLPIGLLRLSFDGGGGGGGSSSNSTTTTSTDKRLAIESGIGISSDSSTVNTTVNALDANIVTKALETVSGADAVAGQGFDKLLGLADKLFTGGFKSLETSQALTTAAFSQGANDTAGTLDNRTIAIVAVAAAAAWAFRK